MRLKQGLLIGLGLGLGSLRMIYSWQAANLSSVPSMVPPVGPPFRLCQVHILCRHGARTPIHVIPNIEQVPYNKSEVLQTLDHTHVRFLLKEESGQQLVHPGDTEKAYQKKIFLGGSEAGQLTTVGQQQGYEFGTILRQLYINGPEKFISHKFSRDDVYLRSTNVKRTIETVRSIMAGIYGKSELNEPFIIHTVNDKDEIFYPNPHCAILRFLAHRDWMRFESPNSEMVKDHQMLEKLLSIDRNIHKLDYVHVRDDIACRQVHGLPTPDLLMPFYDKIDKHAVRLFLFQCAGFSGDDTDLMLKLIAGPMLRRFRDKMDDHVKGVKTPKLYIYGAHDSSVVPLLVALGGYDNQWPPFLANVTFELYSSTSQSQDKSTVKDSKYRRPNYFIRVSYLGKPFKVPGCPDEMCPYDKFWKALSEYEVPKATLPSDCSDQAKHRELSDAYTKQLKDEDGPDSEMPAGM